MSKRSAIFRFLHRTSSGGVGGGCVWDWKREHLRLDRSSKIVSLLLLAFLRRTFAVGMVGAAGAAGAEAATTTAATGAGGDTGDTVGVADSVTEVVGLAAGTSSDSAAPLRCRVDFIWSATAPDWKNQRQAKR